jgi:CheY-like chemotaxis protein
MAAGRRDDVDRFMDSATQSAHRAAALIQRLLAFARRQSLDSKLVDLDTLVNSMEELLRRTLGENIDLQVRNRADTWPAHSDENQLESAVLNLAINARDAMPKGGTLTIETRNEVLDESYVRLHEGLEPGDYAVISVRDTGTGMPPDVLAKVFEPFFTTKPIGQGTGLGLSMIYGFAKQSGGHVRIDSAEGEGTDVSLYLPRRMPQPATVEGATGIEIEVKGDGETVLVVEDDNAVRLIVLDELNELGYTTLEAIDGRTAIPFLQSARKIDLLISDVGLPGMNGRQIAEIARQHRPELPVLFMTGYAENATSRSEFLAPGMEMISKPFAMDMLAAKIREMLRKDADDNLSAAQTTP